jgi:hypothetical protein
VTGEKQGKSIPLQEEYQESGKIGDVVRVSFQIQDLDKADDPLFPGYIVVQMAVPINNKVKR